MIVTIEEVINNPNKFNQCRNCLNPIPSKKHSCATCGCTTFIDDEEKSFNHLHAQFINNLDEEIEI
jgi:rRNA maturation endonuclease Nob1